jgi:hypothetical protein
MNVFFGFVEMGPQSGGGPRSVRCGHYKLHLHIDYISLPSISLSFPFLTLSSV